MNSGVFLLITIFSNGIAFAHIHAHRHPLILVHGFFGQKFYAESDGFVYPESLDHCNNGSSNAVVVPRHKVWIGAQMAQGPPVSDCEVYLLGRTYNAATGNFENRPNVTVYNRALNEPFESLDPLECLAQETVSSESCTASAEQGTPEAAMRPLVQWLVSNLSYVPGVNLFGAAYDWRQHPFASDLDEYYANLKSLIENAVRQTGKKAFLLGYSYGNQIVLEFINNKTSKQWQKTHMQSTLNVAPVFGGAVSVLGNSINIGPLDFIIPNGGASIPVVGNFLLSMSQTAAALPRSNPFDPSQVLVQINQTQYTVANMADFLQILLYIPNPDPLATIYEEYKIEPQRSTQMHCIYGTGLQTPLKYIYPSISETPTIEYGDGDGSVNIESSHICQQWNQTRGPDDSQVYVTELPGVNHFGFWTSDAFRTALRNILIGITP